MAAAGKALAAIQELMRRGVSPNEVYRQTGMKQGIDGKWLDMSQQERMGRASEQGFSDQTYYHGTASNFDAFDSRKLGSTTGARSAKKGVFLTRDPATAGEYASLADEANVERVWNKIDRLDIPFAQRKEMLTALKSRDIASVGDLWPKGAKTPAVSDALSSLESSAENIIPARVKHKNPMVWDAEGKDYGDALGPEGLSEIIEQAQAGGHDALIIKNFNDNPMEGGVPSDHIVTFDPSNIRSTNAAFDPSARDSANLLAGIGGLGVGIGAMGQSGEADASFIGKLAKTFSEPAYKLAKQLEGQGASRDQIWKETGAMGTPLYRGPDGKWRQEISDEGYEFGKQGMRDLKSYGWRKQSSITDNPELFAAYPELGDTLTGTLGRQESNSYYGMLTDEGEILHNASSIADAISRKKIAKESEASVKSTNIHELQHAVQEREGFARGGNTEIARQEYAAIVQSKLDSINAEIIEKSPADKGLTGSDWDKGVAEHRERTKKRELLEEEMEGLRKDQAPAYRAYKRLTGEAEARNVQTRLPYSMSERIAKPPWSTLDVPENELINRFRGVAPYATTAGLLGLGAMPDTARASSTGTIEAARYPFMQTAADYMDKVEVPIIGQPLKGISDWARGVAYDDPDKIKRAAIGAMDLM